MSPMMELHGHSGCVNRLDWNESGTLLASGSDDTTVKIWKPFEYYYRGGKGNDSRSEDCNMICNIQTDHIHNLFGVRFIPGTCDRFLCTGSMDKLVQIQSIERQCTIKNYEIHSDRVKDVQITPRHPFIFYSVSEDGTIRRFDIRLEYKELKAQNTRTIGGLLNKLMHKPNGNVIIELDSKSDATHSLLKGLSINPIRDYEFAIASGDEYVRIFDIRGKSECIAQVTPPHLCSANASIHNRTLYISSKNIHTTFVEYSCDGSQMVVNYHDYRYSQQAIEWLKAKGNECFGRKEFCAAIQYYHCGIQMTSRNNETQSQHALYCNLAMCLYHRMHFNDLLLAIYLTDQAIQCNKKYVKAYFWKIKILNKISHHAAALRTIRKAIELFPNNSDIRALMKQTKAKCKDIDDTKEEEEECHQNTKNNDYEYYQRYTGHCNLKTDIKEATFFGDRYICSGSDDGRCFIWDKVSGQLVNILCDVDQEVVNTVRRHPHFPILAMSGIDSTIKIWQPSCVESTKYEAIHKIGTHSHNTSNDDNQSNPHVIKSRTKIDQVIQQNQQNLTNPPSHQIDLSTLLFWANLMNQ
eukprot:1149530_1